MSVRRFCKKLVLLVGTKIDEKIYERFFDILNSKYVDNFGDSLLIMFITFAFLGSPVETVDN